MFSYYPCSILQAQSIQDIDRLRNKAEIFYSQGEYDRALTHYLDGFRLARQIDKVRAANLTVDISSIYHMRGQYRQGAAICHQGTELLRQAATQPDSVQFKLHSSLGEMYKKLNLQDSCYLYFSRANAILQQHPELEQRISGYVIYHYNNQGMMYVRAGGYNEGLSYLTKALSIAEHYTTSKEDIAILQNNLGEVYGQLGLFGKGLVCRKAALALYPKRDFYKYQILSGASWDALRCAAYEESIVYATNALSLAQSIGQTTSANASLSAATSALNRLGDSYAGLCQYDRAIDYYQQAIKRHNAVFKKEDSSLAASYLGLANVKYKQGFPEAALVFCQKAIRSLSLDNPTPVLAEQSSFEALALKADLLVQRARMTRQLADWRRACDTYDHALMVADAIRKSYNALETKWFFSTQVRPAYLSAFEAAYALYDQTRNLQDKERAFQLLERSKAAALTDITRELLIKPTNVPATLLNRERELQRIIMRQKLEPPARPSTAMIDAQIGLAQLHQRLEKEFPAYYQAKYKPQTVSVAQIQAALDDHTAYLSYLLGRNSLYIAVVTQGEVTLVQKRGDLNTLKSAIGTLNKALYKNPGLGNYTGSSGAIMGYRWLIEPIGQLLADTDRLVISGDNELHRIPFEVLETGRLVDDFLIKTYAISYASSANALLNRPGASPTHEKGSLLSLAPFVKPATAKEPPLELPYLPASQAEVEQLPGEVLLGKAATKRRFMRTYGAYKVLHLATHAYANDTEPARSYIAFYPDGNPDKLYAEEIYNLSFARTRLVVLSACETGNGKLQAGEGVMSLAQAFAYAGCPSIVSTLWGAHDESMAYLSQQLHKHLQAGLAIDVALQRTQLDYFQSELYPKLSHPHYWANLVVMGDSRPVYTVAWASTSVVVILGAVFLLGAILFFRQRVATGRVVVG
ncbi:CHAT domain-containing protein [Spirosoma koreense]